MCYDRFEYEKTRGNNKSNRSEKKTRETKVKYDGK